MHQLSIVYLRTNLMPMGTAATVMSDELSVAIQNCEFLKLTFRIFFVVFPINRNRIFE